MTHIPEQVIELAIDAILNTRELCGNEQRAAYEVAAENGFSEVHLQDKVWRIAVFRANARWNEYQKAAGVNPKYTW